ncbi:cyclin-like protein, partial [Saccharata proteae CBS 121410]
CSSPDIQDVDGVMACINCGSLQSESNIVAEVTFGETSAGAAMVQGGTVNEDQRHANTMGSAARRIGLDAIRGLATSMRITGFIEDQAVNIYRILSLNYNFLAGRRPPTVAACCLYASARMQPGSKLLLIDFAEKIKVNVFKLGEVYKTMCDELMVPELQNQQRIEPEPLVQKYVQKLEFGPAGERRVAEDAIKLLQRMKRDWMVEGRQLAGICGACIVLAARMNNFRRTVREVVYVVKVADMTIAKRLVEFKRTTSARLSVDQFRRVGEKVRGEAEPPAM